MKLKNKRLLSFVLSLVLILAMLPMTAMAADGDYCVAGSAGLCGEEWNASADPMTDNGDGTYSITFADVPAGDYQFKVTDGSWSNSWGKDGGQNNITFTNSKTADVTITFDSSTKLSVVSGDGIAAYVFTPNSITAVGAGAGGFLNDETWNVSAASNHMTNNSGVWSISYTGVAAGTYEFKFAANDAWTDSWGTGAAVTVGEWIDTYYNGGNSKVTVAEDGSTVTLYFDLTAYNADSLSGAKMKVDVTTGSVTPEPTPDPVDAEYVLFGWINGANHACEENASVASDYVFVDGTLTTTFTADSYVAVKTSDNANWYMTDDWQGEVTSVTLYNTTTLGETANKLYVPGGVEVTFTLTVNADDTLTLSYATATVEEPEAVQYQTKVVEGNTHVRLVTYVDSLDYQNVTFNITNAAGETAQLSCETVYEAIVAGDTTLTSAADVFGNDATHFVTYVITSFPTDEDVTVSVTWTDLDGNTVTSEARTINLGSN